MRLAARQLQTHLRGRLEPVYLVSGEDPLLVAEAAAEIRSAARRAGFDERELHVVEKGFKWADLGGQADNLSLFASRRILELRLGDARPGEAGGRVIRALAQRPDPDRIVLLVAGKLDRAAARAAWVKSVEERGALVQVWPLERAELPQWLRARAAAMGLTLTTEAAALLAERVEGNLLAASQELEKLAMTVGRGRIGEQTVLDAVANSARFDVFVLSDAVAAGDAQRALAVLDGLRTEGVEPVLVSWALGRELILLTRLKLAVGRGQSVDQALQRHGVWRRRQPLVKKALARFNGAQLTRLLAQAAAVDGMIKGVIDARPWDGLTQLVISAVSPAARPGGRSAQT